MKKTVADLTSSAEYVFDGPLDAHEWLRKGHPELNGQTPLEAAKSEEGAKRVRYLLNCILHGLPV
jgi:uncharacterized protein (DUF2384 family)